MCRMKESLLNSFQTVEAVSPWTQCAGGTFNSPLDVGQGKLC